ncbi:hypothetical protein BJX99DRAFT_264154 [Aspergillus californicus]
MPLKSLSMGLAISQNIHFNWKLAVIKRRQAKSTVEESKPPSTDIAKTTNEDDLLQMKADLAQIRDKYQAYRADFDHHASRVPDNAFVDGFNLMHTTTDSNGRSAAWYNRKAACAKLLGCCSPERD